MAEIDFSKPGYRPKVLTAEETAAKRAAEQQNNQTIANVNGQTIQIEAQQQNILQGDKLVESETALNIFMPTEQTTYTVQDPNFQNGITGQTEMLVKEQTTTAPTFGMDLLKP